MKYIINMSDEFSKRLESTELGRKTLKDIRMIPFDSERIAAEKRGAEKAWELARKIVNMFSVDRIECFGKHYNTSEVLSGDYSNAAEKYEAWEREKEELHVGDEVTDDEGREAYVLVANATEKYHLVLMEGYAAPQYVRKEDWRKTGYRSTSLIGHIQKAAEQIWRDEGR